MGEALAKLVWHDVMAGVEREYVFTEGATATIGRSASNDIQIAEQFVSRQHAVIQYREGIFMISDLGSSNGTFVNEKRITDPFPLFAGDAIRLYGPTLTFEAVRAGDAELAQQSGMLISAADVDGQGSLVITNGPQEGRNIPLLLDLVRIGRATRGADWEIALQDRSVSRPHAQVERRPEGWYVHDLQSRNGTRVNGQDIPEAGWHLRDGDTLVLGGSILLFRIGWEPASDLPPTSLPKDRTRML